MAKKPRKIKWPSFKRLKNRTAVIDMDIVIYQAVTDHQSDEHLGNDEWSIRVNIADAIDEIDGRVEEIVTLLRASNVVLCVGSTMNWRRRVMPSYKSNRKRQKPPGYARAIELVKQWHNTERWGCSHVYFDRVPWLEADDLLGIWATAGHDKEVIIVSEDKDLCSVPGKWLNPRTENPVVEDITEEEAFQAHMALTLAGDSADGFSGCKGIGKVGAEKLLMKYCDAEKHVIWKHVLDAFHNAGHSTDYAIQTAQVAYILRHTDYDEANSEIKLWTPPTAKGT